EYWCVDPGTDGGSRLCRDHEPAGTRVDPKCRTNYYSPSDLTHMRCLGGYWDYTAKCLPDCGRVTPDGMGLAVGGERVRRGVLPWHAGIYTKTVQRNTTLYEYQQVCGGTLISSKVVISAAHCFWTALEKQLPASQFAVAVGKLYRPWGDPVDQAQKS
ncbi:Hemolymph protein 14, partial [Operophtera brumata]